METNPIDYNNVLADLEAKRDSLNDAIEGIKKMLAISGSGLTAANGDVDQIDASDVRHGSFLGLNIADAALKLLAAAKKPMTSRSIAETLEKAGFHHTSKNFVNTVNTALYRMSLGDDPTVIRIGREGWGLRVWYPGWRRPRRGEVDTDEVTEDS